MCKYLAGTLGGPLVESMQNTSGKGTAGAGEMKEWQQFQLQGNVPPLLGHSVLCHVPVRKTVISYKQPPIKILFVRPPTST